MKNYLAIDQGTTSSRSIIFDSDLNSIKDSQKAYELSYPKDGWVEANPEEILDTVLATIKDVTNSDNFNITSCGITNQRETTIVWSKKTGNPIYPAIIWQDRRTSSMCSNLKAGGNEEMVSNKTGLLLDPYFSASKVSWILDNVPNARSDAESGNLMFGTVDSFLIYKLSKEKNHLTDVTNASRTMLFNIHTMSWDLDLLNLFNIPISMMPEVRDCDSFFGTLDIDGVDIRINGVIGDQQSALVGQACFNNGDLKSTYGTGCFLMVNTKETPVTIKEGLLTTVGYRLNNQTSYALEGSIYSCGNIIQWLRDKMKFFSSSADSEAFIEKNGESNNVKFLPAFNGLGTPYWNSDVRAGFSGITQNSSKEDMITAAFKSICYQTKDIITILESNGISINSLLVDGGMTANKSFLQILADSLQKEVAKPSNTESTALGACIVCQIADGVAIEEIKTLIESKYRSNSKLNNFYKKDYADWKMFIDSSLN